MEATKEQINLFKKAFRGRTDVVAEYWINNNGSCGYSPICSNKFKKVCRIAKGSSKPCDDCPGKNYTPLSDELIADHFASKRILGVYPLLQDNTCYWCAADLDNHDGTKDPLADVIAYYKTSSKHSIPLYVLQSKSGKGFHAYIFFKEPVAAWKARAVCFWLLQEARAVDPTVNLNSFDSLFPKQDELSGEGLGNLIALPFQGAAIEKGNTIFLDPVSGFTKPLMDQWRVLSDAISC